MEFAILGPLEVRDDRGTQLALGKRRQRMLFAQLLLRANEIVSVDVLIEALWPTDPPSRPLASVHSYVAGLRRALGAGSDGARGAERLVTRRPGYLLRVEPGELDLERFTLAAASGREALAAGATAAAREHLHRALSEWQGQALADFAYEPFAERHADLLREQRIDAVEDRIAADLACGFTGVTAECESLLADHPLRERLWELLVVALYRGGRQHEALERCQQLRTTLAELGLEPGEALRRLESAVLSHDPSLETSAPPVEGAESVGVHPSRPTWVGGAAAGFVGRSEELAELGRLWKLAADGGTELAMLLGEPGIGKTSAAAALLTGIDDGVVLAGRCTPEALVPFEPFVEALGAIVERATDADLAKLGTHREHLFRLLPQHADRLGRPGRQTESESGVAGYLLFVAVTALVDLVAAGRPLALLLDDLQHADDSTLALLAHLLRSHGARGLLVVATVRTTDVVDDPRLAHVLVTLRASSGVRTVELPLGGLSTEEIDGYLVGRLGRSSVEHAGELRDLTGGNPLFLAALVTDEQRGTNVQAKRRARPGGVRTLIRARLDLLADPVRTLLEHAAVAGRHLDLHLLSAVTGLAPSEVADGIDQAAKAGLVEETEAGLQFRHDLVREVLVDTLAPARRALLHRGLGEAILTRFADRVDDHVGSLAVHFAQAAVDGDADRAVEFAQRAGWMAIGRSGYHTALARFREGLRALERAGATDEAAWVELNTGLAEAFRRLSLSAEGRRVVLEAAPVALRVGASSETLVRLAYSSKVGIWSAEDRAVTARVLTATFAELERRGEGDGPAGARVLSLMAGVVDDEGDHDQAVRLWRRALDLVLDIGDPTTLLPVAEVCSIGMVNELPLRRRSELAQHMVAAAAPTGDLERIATSQAVARFVALERGDRVVAKRHAAAYEAVTGELGMPRYRAGRAQRRAMVALLEGRLDDAEEQIVETTLQSPDDPEFSEGVAAQILLARIDAGRVEEIAAVVGGAATPLSHVVWRAAAVLAESERGEQAAAVDGLARLVPDVLAAPRDWLWLVAVTLTSWAAASSGSTEHARALRELLVGERHRHVVVNDGLLYLGAVRHHLGALELVAGEPDEAVRALTAAVEAHRRMGARPFEARSLLWLSRAVAAAGGDGAVERAVLLRAEGLALAEEVGLCDLLVRIERAGR